MEDHWRSTLKDPPSSRITFAAAFQSAPAWSRRPCPDWARSLFSTRGLRRTFCAWVEIVPRCGKTKGFVTLPSAGLPSSKPTAQSKQDPKALENRKLTLAP